VGECEEEVREGVLNLRGARRNSRLHCIAQYISFLGGEVVSREWEEQLRYTIRNSTGNEFQALCEKILSLALPDFQAVKAGGPHGDLKSDGYCYRNGTYFAAYAPDRYEFRKTKRKILSDADGALKNWPRLKKWVFVTREKLTADVHKVIEELRTKYPEVEFENWWEQKLIELVGELSENKRGLLLRDVRPTLEQEERDFGIVKEIIDTALSRVDLSVIKPRDLGFTDLSKKIELNCTDTDETEYMREQMLGAYLHFTLIGEVLSSRSAYDQAAVHAEVRERYNRLKCEAKRTIKEILHGLMDWYTPVGREHDARYTHMVRCFVLFFFDDCTWGKRLENSEEES